MQANLISYDLYVLVWLLGLLLVRTVFLTLQMVILTLNL